MSGVVSGVSVAGLKTTSGAADDTTPFTVIGPFTFGGGMKVMVVASWLRMVRSCSPAWTVAPSTKVIPDGAVSVTDSPSAGAALSKVAASPSWGTTCTGISMSSPPALTVNEVWV
jgi:hypothetical protein